MPFDPVTRNRLARFVTDARELVKKEFTEQFKLLYGVSESGEVAPLNKLVDLDDAGRATAARIRERIDYLTHTHSEEREEAKAAVERLAREQAFTIVNRLAAIRMAEKRGLIVESVGSAYKSRGFKVFESVAGTGLGDTYSRYRRYLYCLFDELAVDLGALFDRRSPHGLLFPREQALLALLTLQNVPDLDALWGEDETVGWIYQYYNDPTERKKMRDASPAPRNSRELAVRNQFFTPRYVVEFLTDNTLGRIWYEMRQGQTRLTDQCRHLVKRPNEVFLKHGEGEHEQLQPEGLSQEQLLGQPVYIAHRPLKDPREIRMLDPACGSMHFGLYAFDLFEVIYDEAWDIAEGADEERNSSAAFTSFLSFATQYSSKAAFLADVPRLIIEHNIHGIDIDPRAAQIAGLSLWLRAQRSWQQQGLRSQDRPRIRRSNIVCAEPMPGDVAFLDEFIAAHLSDTPERGLLGQLVRRVFEAMRLAGEAGSLLKIEQGIAGALAEAKQKWLTTAKPVQGRLFGEDTPAPVQQELSLKVSGITDESFWDQAEERIYNALLAYSEQAEQGGGYQRRLFAHDAALGFAFIDLCRKRYDVALMNPPFGLAPRRVFDELKESYRDTYVDLYSCFVSRAIELVPLGLIGAITSRAFLMTKKLARWRNNQIVPLIDLLLDLGIGVMDNARVEAAAYTIRASNPPSLIVAVDRRANLDKCAHIRLINHSNEESVFIVKRAEILTLPGYKLLYQLPHSVFSLLKDKSVLEPNIATARQGLCTFDDFRFVRLRWEVVPSQIGVNNTWEVLAKGGEHAQYYSDLYLLVKWDTDGRELAEVNLLVNGQTAQARQASEYYRRAGATYSKRSAKGFSARALPANCIIATKGPAVLSESEIDAAYLVGWLNSSLIRGLIHIQANFSEFNTGIIKKLPWRQPIETAELSSVTLNAIEKICALKITDEVNSIFMMPPVLSPSEMACRKESLETDALQAVEKCKSSWDTAIEHIYGLRTLPIDAFSNEEDDDNYEDEDETIDAPNFDRRIDSAKTAASLCIGQAFGRWDIRFSTGEKLSPDLPDPFAPLPICPPAQLQNELGLPMTKESLERLKREGSWNYPIEIPWDGILVDDPGHPLDIETRAQKVLQVIWHHRWEDVEREACDVLDVRSLRDYFRRPAGFFADHLKRYSKSRRQAPIYWPLSTRSGQYTLWVYYHRLTEQTLHTALADFVDPKLKVIHAELGALRTSGGSRARIEELAEFEKELIEFRDEIERVINLPWKPNLNDGVLITASPLWKLFRFAKWQKDLKACWEELAGGNYDWAHLAYSIWPGRVEDACRKDRSIAVAHGREDLCAVAPPKPKAKRGKQKPPVEVEDRE